MRILTTALVLVFGIAISSCASGDDIPPGPPPSPPEQLSLTELSSCCLKSVQVSTEDGLSKYRLMFNDEAVRRLKGHVVDIGVFGLDDDNMIATYSTYVDSGQSLDFAALSIYQIRLHFVLADHVGSISEGSYFVIMPAP